jgi:hypothetical protein
VSSVRPNARLALNTIFATLANGTQQPTRIEIPTNTSIGAGWGVEFHNRALSVQERKTRMKSMTVFEPATTKSKKDAPHEPG